MENHRNGTKWQVCRNYFKIGEVIKGNLIEADLIKLIQAGYPAWSPNDYICLADLNLLRTKYVAEVLKSSSQEIYGFEKETEKSLKEEELLSRNINEEFEVSLTLGERLADRINFLNVFPS